jgi:hypothetical protein
MMRANGSVSLGRLIERTHADTAAECYFRVAMWLAEQTRPSAAAVMLRFGVSRSTAFRWLAAYRAASGVA